MLLSFAKKDYLCFHQNFFEIDQLFYEKMYLEDDPNDNETSEEEITYSTDEDEVVFAVLIVFYFY